MPRRKKEEKAGGDEKAPARAKAYLLHRTNGNGRSHPIPEGESSDKDKKPPHAVCMVPYPVYPLAKFLEQNRFCEAFGRIGCFGANDAGIRKKILLFGVVANSLSFLLSLVACASLSMNFNAITFGSFSKGDVFIPAVNVQTSKIWIGLRGVAMRTFKGQALVNPNYVEGDNVVAFDEFCDLIGNGLENYMDADSCDACAEVSGGLMTSVVMACVLTIPNIFTDILRMYPNYDVNCQKFFGSILNLASSASSLYAWRGYADLCFNNFYDESPVVDFEWRAGTGLVCIVLATLLKAFDIIAMLVIPTPDLANTQELQEEYETLYGDEEEAEEGAEGEEGGGDEVVST